MEQNTISPDEWSLLFPPCHKMTVENAVYRLTRFLRHNRGLLLKAEKPLIDAIIKQWMERAQKLYRASLLDVEDVHEQIRTAWVSAAYPLGIDPLTEAVELAKAIPPFPTPPPTYGELHGMVFRVCHWMNVQAVKRQQPYWFLSCNALAARLGKHPMLIFRALARMERDKLLSVRSRGDKRRANRYDTRMTEE